MNKMVNKRVEKILNIKIMHRMCVFHFCFFQKISQQNDFFDHYEKIILSELHFRYQLQNLNFQCMIYVTSLYLHHCTQ